MECVTDILGSVDVDGAPMGTPALRLFSFGNYEVAPHECCEGALVIAYSSIYPTSDPFPTPLQQTSVSKPRPGGGWGCSEPHALPLTVQYLTCVQTVDGSGNMPSADARNAEHRRLILAAQTVLGELGCCVQAWRSRYGLAKMNTGITFLAPQGGCAGFELSVIAPVDPCYTCS